MAVGRASAGQGKFASRRPAFYGFRLLGLCNQQLSQTLPASEFSVTFNHLIATLTTSLRAPSNALCGDMRLLQCDMRPVTVDKTVC